MSKQENGKDKLRVYEYAKSNNMSSKEIITILKRLDYPVNNHMSVMENDAVAKVEQYFKDVKANAQSKRDSKPQAQVSQAAQQSTEAPKRHERSEQRPRQDERGGRPEGRGQQGHQGGPRGGQGGNRQGGDRPSRPQGQGGRPQGQGGQGGNRQGGDRPSRPQGQGGRPQGQGGRPQGQGGSQGNRSGGPSSSQQPARPAMEKQQPARLNNGVDRPSKYSDNDKSGAKGGNRGRNNAGKPNNRFDDNRGNNRGPRGKGRNNRNNHRQMEVREKIDNTPKKIIVRGEMSVGELAKLLHKDASEVIKKLFMMGLMVTINQEVDLDTIQLIADEYKVEVELKLPVQEDPFEEEVEPEVEENMAERPPVVTIMGHVDHGKTTLLDSIRKTNVTSGEAGGITQHIGAYQVEINNKKITFLDTPGHEAFTLMRARGAQVTDITIIVVAADDGVMPQTVEAISHAKAAGVPIIVAVNKIDKPEADPDRVKQELTNYELVPEEWGGDTIFVNVSAKQRMGLEDLLEMILLVAEVQEFKANPDKLARGTVIEAELDKGRGPVARILVQSGTLKVGDPLVAGTSFGRVRAMVNDRGRRLKEAGPSTPVEITGLTEVPQAGDPFIVFEDERKARSISEKRSTTLRQSQLGSNARVTLDDLFKHIKEGEIKELNVIIKADVQGSVEALRGSLEKIEVEGVRVKVIHSGAGAITESDIILATASNAIVIGFNVRPDAQAKLTADQEQVDVRLHRVIYTIVEEIEQAMKGMLDPEYKEVVQGHAEVRDTFKISKVGTIAGCMVTSGKITRNSDARVIRDGIVIFEGKLDSLKRFKDDAKEVAQGYECGIMLDKFNDLKEGDIIEAFTMEAVERK
ncbi:translation initiation factor IF-2 [Paenibacillus aquistagni]|uniref:translation initiation factor IF-2 n=1 Tax=Paenibacillus aquistagni TaxID=1852522 RepID=UPI00145B4859|nr:translation initiation factor IF-2 [Paenibacillus aquistagni]NMM51200.1 translation initiation factor IF-2 [Paenibacillus aquistagni]